MKTLIIGKGQIGKALEKHLSKHYKVFSRDKKEIEVPFKPKIIHICYPYFNNFVKTTLKYIQKYSPKYVVLHSTVKVGTTRKIQQKTEAKVVHSPIIGVHPNLERGFKLFPKWVAPRSHAIKRYFERTGMKVDFMQKPEETELAKILSTTYFGWNIVFCKEVWKLCRKFKVDFKRVYSEWNEKYNEGYLKWLEYKDLKYSPIRPVLVPGVFMGKVEKIGGHCVIPNCKLLSCELTKIILKFNQAYYERSRTKK